MSHLVYLLLILTQSLTPVLAASNGPVITLRRTECFGSCPVYEVTIYGDGFVVYEGREHVRVQGVQHTKIAPADVSALIQAFREADYFNLQNEYRTIKNADGTETHVTDMPTVYTSITLKGRHKEVEDYVGAPGKLKELEQKIDDASGSKHWVAMDAQAVHEEVKRGWNPNGNEGQRQLLRAVERGDAEVVQAFIADGANVKAIMVNVTLLQDARTPEVVKLLIAAGADVNAATDDFGPPLTHSAELGEAESVRTLLQAGADISMRDHDGRTATMLAAFVGSPEAVQVLLEAGADVNARDPEGQTALTLAHVGLKRQEELSRFPQPFATAVPDYQAKYKRIFDYLVAAGAKE